MKNERIDFGLMDGDYYFVVIIHMIIIVLSTSDMYGYSWLKFENVAFFKWMDWKSIGNYY